VTPFLRPGGRDSVLRLARSAREWVDGTARASRDGACETHVGRVTMRHPPAHDAARAGQPTAGGGAMAVRGGWRLDMGRRTLDFPADGPEAVGAHAVFVGHQQYDPSVSSAGYSATRAFQTRAVS
jgi:hypothetical protein